MANKRETSSQRRQRENRARRAALEARTKGAPSRPSRVAPATAEKLAKASSTKTASGGSSKADPQDATTRSGRPRRERPPKPGDKPVDIATLEGSWPRKVIQVPGGLQALMGSALVVFVSLMVSFTNTYVPKGSDKGAKPSLTALEFYGTGKALLIMAVPALAAFAATGLSLTKHRRRIWFLAAAVIGIVSGGLSILYLFVAGTFVWAYFRANKVEGPPEPLLRRKPRGDQAEGVDDADASSPAAS